MEFIITILCSVIFLLLIDQRKRLNWLHGRIVNLMDVVKIEKRMEDIENRMIQLGGGAPNPPHDDPPNPQPPPPPDDE